MRIKTVWYFSNDSTRIHYTVVHDDGSQRHLREPIKTEWGIELVKMHHNRNGGSRHRGYQESV